MTHTQHMTQTDVMTSLLDLVLLLSDFVVSAVRGLLRPSHRQQPETNVYIEEEDG